LIRSGLQAQTKICADYQLREGAPSAIAKRQGPLWVHEQLFPDFWRRSALSGK
jgi:hypothetical protein